MKRSPRKGRSPGKFKNLVTGAGEKNQSSRKNLDGCIRADKTTVEKVHYAPPWSDFETDVGTQFRNDHAFLDFKLG